MHDTCSRRPQIECYIARMRNKLYLLLLGSLLLVPPLAAEKKAIAPPEFAGATANFSPGILVDGTLYVSGQIGQDLKTKQVPADFETEVKTLLSNIGIVLKAGGMTYKDVVSVRVYLTDIDLFQRMNAVYTTFFPEPRPTRTTVGVTKLAAAAAHIEITVTARK
jgi:2-iminobutanoate/2-iminopropanoate deaminase